MKYYAKKLLSLILTLLFVALLSFFLFQVIQGDAALSKLGIDAGDEELEAIREMYGYNKSLPERFVSWLAGALKGDFGYSIKYSGMTVNELIAQRLPVTLTLAFMSVVMIIVIAIPVALLTSKKQDGVADRASVFMSQLFMAIPPFLQGILVTLLFGIVLGLFVPGAYVSYDEDFGAFLAFMIFPAISVALPKAAMTVKFMKSSIRRERAKDYVRTARAKGNSDRGIMWKHILKNSLMPVITFVGLIIAEVMAGSIMIEQVFNLPGMGRLLVTSISNRDFPVVQAIVIYIAAVVIIVNFIVDVLQKLLDPRL